MNSFRAQHAKKYQMQRIYMSHRLFFFAYIQFLFSNTHGNILYVLENDRKRKYERKYLIQKYELYVINLFYNVRIQQNLIFMYTPLCSDTLYM